MKSQFEFERRSIKLIRNKHAVQTIHCNLIVCFLTIEKWRDASNKVSKSYPSHHVYKNAWSPCKGKTLTGQPDNRDEAQENYKYAVGIYKKNDDGSKELVGHAPVKFSSLLYHFLQASAENCINLEVIGKRKREVGLVVPAKYSAFTRNKKIAMVLDEELAKRKKLCKSCLKLKHQRKNIYRMFPVYQ